jgi:phage/plasmid primase-like uncharacterized protein
VTAPTALVERTAAGLARITVRRDEPEPRLIVIELPFAEALKLSALLAELVVAALEDGD